MVVTDALLLVGAATVVAFSAVRPPGAAARARSAGHPSARVHAAARTETTDREVPVDAHAPHVVGDSASERAAVTPPRRRG